MAWVYASTVVDLTNLETLWEVINVLLGKVSERMDGIRNVSETKQKKNGERDPCILLSV